MFYDYHMHSSFSNDSKSDMEDMIKKSIELGLKEICFTDHVDYDTDSDDDWEIDYNKYLTKQRKENLIAGERLSAYLSGVVYCRRYKRV